MIIKAKLEDKKTWNQFVAQSPMGSFLQSWEWGEFQKSLGRKIFRLKIINQGKLVGTALLIKHDLPRQKSYLYSPRGPVFGTRNWSLKIGQNLLKTIFQIAQKEKAVFFKIEPKEILKPDFTIPANFRKSYQVQPELTQILNLQKSEDELLKQMHSKTRYNLKLAEKRGVKIRISTNPKEAQIFWQMLGQTIKRDHFKAFSESYYQKFLENLEPSGLAKLFLAEYQGEVIAAAIVCFFGDEAYYIHGASADKFRNVMAPHLLQWRAIQEAKNQGLKWYDFWGVSPENQPRHKWAGISRFKRSFSGQQIQYPGSLDFVFKPSWYFGYKIISFLKRIF